MMAVLASLSLSGPAILLPASGMTPAGHLLPTGGRIDVPCDGFFVLFGHHPLAPVRSLTSRIGVLFRVWWRGSG